MTNWHPDPSTITRPAYLSLADQIACAINDGKLEAGERLPTHRKLADDLKLSVQTVSRAYDELIRRDLLSGEVGRGTFVKAQRREIDQPYLPERLGEVIDLSILKPVCDAMHHERMKQALSWLSETIPASSVLSFRPNVVFPRHRVAAVKWLQRCGLDVPAANISVTNGATAAMTVAIMSVAPVGSTIVTEAIGHHTLGPLASYLGLTLKGIAIDDQGVVPEALDAACAEANVRALFVQPAAINPCATVMGLERRAQLVEVARQRDIAIVESDLLGPLIEERVPPIAALAPERTLYFTSFTKTVVPGLRIGYLVAPDRYIAAVSNRHLVSNWMATPMVAEIATRWIDDGTAIELVNWQREALRRRHEIAADVFSDMAFLSHPQSLHIWLPLHGDRSEEAFVAQARLQNVAIAPGASFRILEENWKPAVRISLGSTNEGELLRGLRVVRALLEGDPEHLLLAI